MKKWEERRSEKNNKGIERETRKVKGKKGRRRKMGSPKEVREKRGEKMGGEERGGEARRLRALSALKKRAAQFFFGTNNGFL